MCYMCASGEIRLCLELADATEQAAAEAQVGYHHSRVYFKVRILTETRETEPVASLCCAYRRGERMS